MLLLLRRGLMKLPEPQTWAKLLKNSRSRITLLAFVLIAVGLWSLIKPSLDFVAYGAYVNDLKILKEETLVEIQSEAPISYDTLHKRLLDLNSDYQGWLKIEGTQIDFPYVQGADNSFYLTHNHVQEDNSIGSVFMDYRNNPDDTRWFLYGHTVNGNAMFGSLVKYRDEAYFKAHPTIKLYLPTEIRTYTVFSVETIDADVTMIFDSELSEEPGTLVKRLAQASEVIFSGELPVTNQVLTLVSCEYTLKNGRVFVSAALTSVETVTE